MSSDPVSRRWRGAWAWSAIALLLTACAAPSRHALDEADRLWRSGDAAGSLERLDRARQAQPDDAAVLAAWRRQRERLVLQRLAQADLARSQGRSSEAEALLDQAHALDAQHPRVLELAREIQRERSLRDRIEPLLTAARRALEQPREGRAGGPDPLKVADAALQEAASLLPQHPAVREVSRQLAQARLRVTAERLPPEMAESLQKPVSLEFRDAPLKQVFEALARTAQVNFVFDKDVKGDARVTVFLRQVTLDEAMRVILATQQLDRKLLNERTVLVYPNTPAKQREHQELVTRSLFLANADVRHALALVRTMAKTRDLHADERLNALVVRDTPEVVRLVERLLRSIDLPDPEVTVDVEVMEVASDRLAELGLAWPDEIRYGLPNLAAGANLPLAERSRFRGWVANPALAAALRESDGATQLLANPTIRARNREKAKVHIGEKLPVFTTTSTANVGVSAAVNYLDIGLKLDVEPTIQLDGDVTLRVTLEVSNLLSEVSGPQDSLAYRLGTRLTSTSLRLHDGETQVLAGLVSDEDRKRASGVPGLVQAPLAGRLFGVHEDRRQKTEIVLLMTPRIVRNVSLAEARGETLASGTDALPGAAPVRLRPLGRAGLEPASTARTGALGGTATATAQPASADVSVAQVSIDATREVQVGGIVSVTIANGSAHAVRGQLAYDPQLLQLAQADAVGTEPGRIPFELDARGQQVVVLRALPAAAGRTVAIEMAQVAAGTADQPVSVQAEVTASVQVRPGGGPP